MWTCASGATQRSNLHEEVERLGSDVEVLKAQIADVKSGLSIDDELTVKDRSLRYSMTFRDKRTASTT